MLGPGSPHGDSHRFLSSAPLLNNLAVTFPPSAFIFPSNFFFFLLAVSKEDNFSACWDGGAELGWVLPGAHSSLPSLLCPLLSGLWERGRGSSCRGWGREGRRSQVAWVTLLLGRLGPPGWLDSKVGRRAEKQNSFRGPREGSQIGRVPTVL